MKLRMIFLLDAVLLIMMVLVLGLVIGPSLDVRPVPLYLLGVPLSVSTVIAFHLLLARDSRHRSARAHIPQFFIVGSCIAICGACFYPQPWTWFMFGGAGLSFFGGFYELVRTTRLATGDSGSTEEVG